jgi:hypothetical protein
MPALANGICELRVRARKDKEFLIKRALRKTRAGKGPDIKPGRRESRAGRKGVCMNKYEKECYYRERIIRSNGHWHGRGTNLARRVQEALWELNAAKRHLESLSRPEEKYQAALEEYHKVAEEHADTVIRAQTTIDDLQGRLSKPWREYASSRALSRYSIKSHKVANDCALLDLLMQDSKNRMEWAKRHLEEARETLDNFCGLKTKAERDLEAAKLNYEAERRAQDRIIEGLRVKAQKVKPRKPIPSIRVRKDGADFILDGVGEFFKAGARGLTVISEKGVLSIPRGRIYPALKTLDRYTVHVNGALVVCHASGYLRYAFPEHPDWRYENEVNVARKET